MRREPLPGYGSKRNARSALHGFRTAAATGVSSFSNITKVIGDAVQHTLATIDEKFAIFVAEGAATGGGDYDPNSTKTHRFEILENGRIEQDY